MNRVVIVDDEVTNLKLYGAVVRRVLGQDAITFDDPVAALRELRDLRPPLILVDYRMPEMDGLEFVSVLRTVPGHEFTPVVMLTVESDRSLPKKATEAGVTAYLERPNSLKELTAQIRRYAQPQIHGSSRGEVVMPTDERDTISRLHRALAANSVALARHVAQARDVAVLIGSELHLGAHDMEALRVAGLVYDIGMLAVPEKVRLMPDALPARWRSVVNAHVDAGGAILAGGQRPLMRAAESMARYHHERYDGAGYPEGLAGEEIPLLARIIAVADTYVALVSDRPHRVEFTRGSAAAQIKGQSGTAFDPVVVDAFLAIKDRLGALAPPA
jgi:putative two-component system response regulator